jgi:hypothetical protein
MVIVTTVKLTDEVVEFLNKNVAGSSISGKLREVVTSTLIQEKYLEQLIIKKEHEILALKEIKKTKGILALFKIDDKEREHLMKDAEILKENPNYFVGRHKAYNNLFNRTTTLTDYKAKIYELQNV